MTVEPPERVLERFGLDGRPMPLPGGEGATFRIGEVVLKRVHDAEEAEWVQALLARTEQDGFRLADPVPTIDGDWVHDDWSASRFVRGLRPAAPFWSDIGDAGLRFGDAAERVRGAGEALSRRTHRWAVADRVAWQEEGAALGSEASEVHDLLSALITVGSTASSDERRMVHGDLAGNVFFDPESALVILDVSPYLRPRRWAVAIVIADAVLWHGADLSVAKSFSSDPTDRDLFGRALIFRLVAEQIADVPRHGALLEPYRRVVAAVR